MMIFGAPIASKSATSGAQQHTPKVCLHAAIPASPAVPTHGVVAYIAQSDLKVSARDLKSNGHQGSWVVHVLGFAEVVVELGG